MSLPKIIILALLTYVTYQTAKEFENVYICVAAMDILALFIIKTLSQKIAAQATVDNK